MHEEKARERKCQKPTVQRTTEEEEWDRTLMLSVKATATDEVKALSDFDVIEQFDCHVI